VDLGPVIAKKISRGRSSRQEPADVHLISLSRGSESREEIRSGIASTWRGKKNQTAPGEVFAYFRDLGTCRCAIDPCVRSFSVAAKISLAGPTRVP